MHPLSSTHNLLADEAAEVFSPQGEDGDRGEDTTLKTVRLLRSGFPLQELVKKYSLKMHSHKKYPQLIELSYSQVDSPMGSTIVQECRGLILDQKDNWKVVAYPYRKFFNYGESYAKQLDWDSAKVTEKIDGSLITLYEYNNEWHVATSKLPDASGSLPTEKNATFASLFWSVWHVLNYKLPEKENNTKNHKYCYMFELISPKNTVIVQHNEESIILHGVRDLTTLKELDPEPFAEKYGWKCVKSYPIKSLEEVIQSAKELNPTSSEGFVVCDKNFLRLKIKSPQYVALHHLSSFNNRKVVSPFRRILQILQTNEGEEFLTYFPMWRSAYSDQKKKFDELCAEVNKKYLEVKEKILPENVAHELPYWTAINSMIINEITAREAVSSLDVKVLEALIEPPSDAFLPTEFGKNYRKKVDPEIEKMMKQLNGLKEDIQEISRPKSRKKKSAGQENQVFSTIFQFSKNIQSSAILSNSTEILLEFGNCLKLSVEGDFDIFSKKQRQQLQQVQQQMENLFRVKKNAESKSDTHSNIEQQIIKTLATFQPSAQQEKQRQNLFEELSKKLAKVHPDIQLSLFGSTASGISTSMSDMDISFNFKTTNTTTTDVNTNNTNTNNTNTNNTNINTIATTTNTTSTESDKEEQVVLHHVNSITEILKKCGMKNVNTILTARTPVVKFEDPETEIHADLSYGNHLGVLKAELLRYFFSVDNRAKMMILCVKYWAKRRAINDATNFTLNSFVLAMLVIFFLQKRKPPILPVLSINGEQENSEKLKKLTKMPLDNPEKVIFPTYEIPPKENWSTKNTEKIAQLLTDFFKFYAVQFDYARDCISVRVGKNLLKSRTLIVYTSTPTIFCVEDPFIITENCARTVTEQSIVHIRAEFNRAYQLLNLAGGNFDKICEIPRQKRKKEIEQWKVSDSKKEDVLDEY